MIHIQYVSAGDLENSLLSGSNYTGKASSKGGLCSAFCVADKSEQEAYDEVNHSFEKAQATKDSCDIATCKDRHKDCLTNDFYQWVLSSKKFKGERLTFDNNLSVLAVSRQLYEESNNILWQTNVFSFDRPVSFTIFNQSMNTAQKHKLKKIHLRMDVNIDTSSGDWAFWPEAITQRVLTPLKNLKVIHGSIDQCCLLQYDGVFTLERTQILVGIAMDQMLGFRLLPWKNKENTNQGKHVTVVISDIAFPHVAIVTPDWTRTQKLEAAEKLRARLAAPNSAEIHTAEIKAMKDALEGAEQRWRER